MVEVLVTRDGLVGNSPRYTNHTSPPYQRVLTDDSGAIINLTGISPSALEITLVNQSNPLLVKTGGGTFSIPSPATQGLISYQYAQEDIADAGNWFLFLTLRLPGEATPRVFDPELLEIYMFPGGTVFMTVQDVNLTEINGTQVSSLNPVPMSGPVTMADGASIALGATTDSSSASTTIGLLKAIKAYLAGTLTTSATVVSGTITETNSASIKNDLDTLALSTGAVSDAAWSGSGNGSEIAILKKLVAQLAGTLGISGTVTANIGTSGSLALETGGNLATITTRTPALGQAAMAASSPVVIASNQSSVPVSSPTSGTATLSNVAASATTVSILASNASRKGAIIQNDSSSAMYLAYAATASTTAYTVKIPANTGFEMPITPVYTGAMSAVWDTATGSARITELS
jgi:hypothetical protein